MDLAERKRRAAEHAADMVDSGMVLGLGTGSTAAFAIRRLAERLRTGDLRNVTGIPTSNETASLARQLGVPLLSNEEHPAMDMTIDGADEVDPALDMIKGGGGALLKEKIVAQSSRLVVIVVDESKLSPVLGSLFHLPVEVTPFAWRYQASYIEALGAHVSLRLGSDGAPFYSDEGNLILDCRFGPIGDKRGLADRLQSRAGIVEHGLFLGLASEVIVAGEAGVRTLRRPDGPR